MTDVVGGVEVTASSITVDVAQGTRGPQGPQGPAGDDGTGISAASGAPSDTANAGDLYIDTATGDLYRFS